jgi:uncharacterized protein (TIGR02099 family)
MRQNNLRSALFLRFARLALRSPLLTHPAAQALWRTLVWAFWLLYFSFVLLVLLLRYSVLPNIEHYRADIEQRVSQALGQTVSIGHIEARWAGINPDLTLLDVRVADAQGRPALALARVETVLSWWSVPNFQLRLQRLNIDEPSLHLRRAADGQIFIAGIPLRSAQNDGAVSRWVLAQQQIRIRGATVVWEDALRNAPALVLEDLNFGLDNSPWHHRFGLTALPPSALASKLDVRGDFSGDDLARFESWTGRLFAEIDYADLAGWRHWIDYPLALPHGQGALRTWAGFANGAWRDVTADLALEDLSLRLNADLPALELERMTGRLAVKFSPTGFALSGRGIALTTRPLKSSNTSNTSNNTNVANNAHASKNGEDSKNTDEPAAIHIAPTDFHLDWQPKSADAGNQAVRASLAASQLNLDALSALAAYLPLTDSARALLQDFAPRGQIVELRASGRSDDLAHLQAYSLKANFADLTLKAQGHFPGFSRLSGTLEASEQGGSATLRSLKSSIDLPTILPESAIDLDTLNAEAKWKIKKDVLEAELSHIDFTGPDAAGSAQGSYRYTGEGPGHIDLKAALSRVDGRAVWRYMPSSVNTTTRHWLRDAITTGNASDAKLVLQGDLTHFPFVDKKQGQFLATAKAHDVTLHYATGWPEITGIDGDLRFEGAGMLVNTQHGAILGAQLTQTRAEIADLHVAVGMLKVKGHAEGPTAEFLKFIEQSPVGAQIDHFTADMRASGNGRLDLALLIPLDPAHVHNTKIDGSYRFLASGSNELTVDPALPPLRGLNGLLQFSEKDLRIPEINATLFGGPLQVKGGTQADGKLLIAANGSLSVAQLRKQADLPLFENLSGMANYRGEVRVKKRSADLTIDSNLLGLASSLPEPFNKSAGEALTLHLEKTSLPTVTPRNGEPILRDQLQASLGNSVAMQMIRRKQNDGYVPERGALAIGRPLQLPERGIALAVSAKRLDLDYWRQALHTKTSASVTSPVVTSSAVTGAVAPPSPTPSGSALPFTAISLKANELLLLGHRFNEVDLGATATPSLWQVHLKSREASGDLQWDSTGRGKLSARFKRLQVDPAASQSTTSPVSSEVLEELPALDIVADDFVLGTRHFGRLELQAHNESRVWRLDKIVLTNPYADFAGNGQWQIVANPRAPTGTPAEAQSSQLNFKLKSNDTGKLLERLGHPGAVRGGTAQLDGKIAWNGAPFDLDYASLGGELKLEASKGQFLKLDPGAGKLLALISLQALPRRITLDFRDVFSDGFAFDSIGGELTLKNGLMRTERLQIDGPAARVLMRGETDLQNETQRLNVNVQPDLGSGAAFGVALLNPLAGVAALLAHKILQNPLDQIFGFDYLVTGTWDDPKVEKIARPPASTTAPSPHAPGANNAPAKQ